MQYTGVIIETLGGVGLFLLGMIIMTDSLKYLAGNAMRRVLMKFTKSPLSGACTGAIATVILRSSSATTVAAVGFVGAGLLSFPHALGIIFGANIGTTLTGWIVALLGFKYKLGTAVLPLIFAGTIMKLVCKGRWSHVGIAIAGFGIIFVGISMMQSGMSNLPSFLNPQDLPSGSLLATLQVVGLGILATIIMQSSSAGVAVAMTALVSGAINLHQAMALVIGMDIGTTVTAALATVGGSIGAKRTGLSHVIYNFITGIGALCLVFPYIYFVEHFMVDALNANAEMVLVAFHSGFNIIGVILVLPFTNAFASFIEKMITPSQNSTNELDDKLLEQSDLALSIAHKTLFNQTKSIFLEIERMMGNKKNKKLDMLIMQEELDKTQEFIDKIEINSDPLKKERLIAMLHALDHLQRLHERCDEESERAIKALNSHETKEASKMLIKTLEDLQDLLEKQEWAKAVKISNELLYWMKDHKQQMREKVVLEIADGMIETDEGTDIFEAIRWMRRVSRHISHTLNYLSKELNATS